MLLIVWVPACLLFPVIGVIAGDPLGWPALATVIGLVGLGNAWEIVVMFRRVPPVVVDASGIDLQGSGPVPWQEIRAVVCDRRRLWLELNRDTAAFVASRTFPPWFTAAHENLLGDAAWIAPGHIHVPVRWVHATPDELAIQLRRFATVPVRMETSAAANSH